MNRYLVAALVGALLLLPLSRARADTLVFHSYRSVFGALEDLGITVTDIASDAGGRSIGSFSCTAR